MLEGPSMSEIANVQTSGLVDAAHELLSADFRGMVAGLGMAR